MSRCGTTIDKNESPPPDGKAVKKSPPILGGDEARQGFGGGKGRVQTTMGANRHDRPPPEGLRAFSSRPDPRGIFSHLRV